MEEYSDRTPADIARYPMVPIRDVVIFPFTKVAFKIGRPGSVRALEMALASDRTIFLVDAARRDGRRTDARANLSASERLRASCNRRDRKTARSRLWSKAANARPPFALRITPALSPRLVRRAPAVNEEGVRTDALVQKIAQLIEQHLRLAPDVQPDALQTAMRNADPSHMADALASQLRISVEDKQGLLELFSAQARLARLIEILEIELEKRQLDRTIQTRVKRQMEKAQKEYYLNEQIKAIHKELGRKDERAELDELKKKIEEAGMTEEAKEKALQELHRLEAMPPMSAEGTVSRTYIDWLVSVPWKQKSKEIRDLDQGRRSPERRSLWSGEDQGSHPRISRRSPTGKESERIDSLLCRPAGSRQDQPRQIDCPRDRQKVCAASRWAACATKPRFAATVAPISAPCPARSFR